jgi:hypothetical protein
LYYFNVEHVEWQWDDPRVRVVLFTMSDISSTPEIALLLEMDCLSLKSAACQRPSSDVCTLDLRTSWAPRLLCCANVLHPACTTSSKQAILQAQVKEAGTYTFAQLIVFAPVLLLAFMAIGYHAYLRKDPRKLDTTRTACRKRAHAV